MMMDTVLFFVPTAVMDNMNVLMAQMNTTVVSPLLGDPPLPGDPGDPPLVRSPYPLVRSLSTIVWSPSTSQSPSTS